MNKSRAFLCCYTVLSTLQAEPCVFKASCVQAACRYSRSVRQQKGLSQEELAGRLNVSRQTVSKWEIGDSTPDMEKLVAMSELFDVSLDMLVLGKEEQPKGAVAPKSDFVSTINEKVLTTSNKEKAKSILKIVGFIAAAVLLIDVVSMIIYFVINGMPV